MPDWEYRKIDLNQHRPRGDDLDMLNAAGADGWELVAITTNNIAYLKRRLDRGAPPQAEPPSPARPKRRKAATTAK